MKIPPARYPSPLGRMQATPMDVEAAKRQAWRNQHILVISDEDERLDFLERQLIRRIGERLYGHGHDPSHGHAHAKGGGHG
jgi:hypothetical protein